MKKEKNTILSILGAIIIIAIIILTVGVLYSGKKDFVDEEDDDNHNGARDSLDKDVLNEYRKKVQEMKVVVFPIDKEAPYTLHFLEVALAGLLKARWNTFKTH